MTRPRPRIGSELLLVCLILGCLASTWFLVVSMHHRAERRRKPVAKPLLIARQAPRSKPAPPPPPPPPRPEPEPPPPPPIVEDPTRKVLARLGAEEAEQRLEAEAADRKAAALERARQAAVDDSSRWRRREQIIHGQVDRLADQAQRLATEVDALARERDVLAHEVDATKAALSKASHRSSFAVLPNRTPNGTWRRPIVIECRNGTATLQPHGPTFSLLDLSGLLTTRSSPIVIAVVRELVRLQGLSAPDGSPSVPYIFFVVRPDGIRPYYEARARLESLGIAFGYELVDQDMEIDFPDLDHPDEWDGSAPLPSFPVATIGNGPSGGANGKHSVDDFRWPTSTPGGSGGRSDLAGDNRRLGRGSGPDAGGLEPFPPGGLGRGGPYGDPADGNQGDQPFDPTSTLGFGPSSGRLPARPGRSSTPGMLPPVASGGGAPGRLPPGRGGMNGMGAGSANSGPETGDRPPWTSAGSGNAFSNPNGAPTTGPGSDRLPGGLASAEPPGTQGPAPDGSVPPQVNDLSRLDGLSLLRRLQSEAAGNRPGGLRPGEPGAPPEDGSGRQGTGPDGPGTPGSSRAGGTPGLTSPSGAPNASGLNLVGRATSGSASGSSSSEPGSEGKPGEEDFLPRPRGPLKIEVPMEIVVACGPSGVTIHPGGYQLTGKTLKGKDEVLARSLRTIVRQRQQVDPMIRPRPSIRYLVEPGGGETYREARRQTILSGLDWPTVLQVSDTRVLDFLPRERF